MSEKIHILMLEDVPEDAELNERELRKAGIVFDSVVVDTEEAFTRALDDFKPDVILADYSLPSFNCFSALEIAQGKCTDVPVIVVTGSVGDELAVEMLKKGATDYILKDRLMRLAPAIHRALGEAQVKNERRRAEEALRESEKNLKEAQRLGRIGHWEYDLKTLQISWSDMVFTLYERDPKLGPPTEEEEAAYYSPEDAGRLHNFAGRAINTGEPWEVDVSVRLPGERLMNCVSIGKPIKDARGQVIKIYGTIQDITDRKRAERALQFTRFALDNAADSMVTVAQDGRYIDVNDAFCRSVGYSREELLSMSVHDIDPNHPAEIWPEFWEKLKQSGSLKFESRHRTKEGKVFPVEITASFFEYNGPGT